MLGRKRVWFLLRPLEPECIRLFEGRERSFFKRRNNKSPEKPLANQAMLSEIYVKASCADLREP